MADHPNNNDSMSLSNKRVLLGISAGIAAYKTPDLVRKLTELGAQVQVIMSKNSDQFVAPLALQAVAGHPVHNYAMTAESESGMGHIDLARWADVIAIAPAMNQQMWQNQATQANMATLAQRGTLIFGPDTGEQACGEVGPGRMLQPVEIAAQLGQSFYSSFFSGKRVMITAGPTWEALDPVRGITNHSSGMMGYAIAQAAIEAGADVTLVSGPTNLTPPERCKTLNVISALEMHEAVMQDIAEQDIFIGVAAVADYRPVTSANQKIKKNAEEMTISMIKNPDILADVAARKNAPMCIGFAAETNDVIDYARAKLEHKNLDLIAANHVGGTETGFGTPDNAITLISKDEVIQLPKQNKYALARALVKAIADQFNQHQINT